MKTISIRFVGPYNKGIENDVQTANNAISYKSVIRSSCWTGHGEFTMSRNEKHTQGRKRLDDTYHSQRIDSMLQQFLHILQSVIKQILAPAQPVVSGLGGTIALYAI
jgi:hypothetical protein